MPEHMSQELMEDPAAWTAEHLLAMLAEDDGVDISQVSDEALGQAIPVAQTNGWSMQLAALMHEDGRRSVLRGQAAPAEPAPLPARHEYPANAEEALRRDVDAAVGQLVYEDTYMLPAEISLQTAVEIEAFLNERGTAVLHAADGSISFEIECADLWDACEAAHEVATELQSHGIDAVVDRDLLRPVGEVAAVLTEESEATGAE